MSIIQVVAIHQVPLVEQPSLIYIQTTDDLATVLGVGYLNEFELNPPLEFVQYQMALVLTTEGCIFLSINISSPDISLVYPLQEPD